MKRYLVVVMGFTLVGLGLAEAPAAAETAPVIVSPANGSTQTAGGVDVTVDFTGSAPAVYTMDIYDDDWYYEQSFTHHYDGTPATATWTFATEIFRSGAYTIDFYDEFDSFWDASTFVVEPLSAAIVSPAPGTVKAAWSSLSASVQWDNIPAGITVRTGIVNSSTSIVNNKCEWVGPAPGAVTTCASAPLRPGRYTIYANAVNPASGGSTRLDTVTFTVEQPFDITSVGVSPDNFFPLVRDGYRDTTTVAWRTTSPSWTKIIVATRSGRRVRTVTIAERQAGRHTWAWNGRNDNGSKVSPGTYIIRLVGHGHFRQTDTVQRRVTVDTGYRVENWVSWRAGWSPSSVSATGTCSATEFWDSTFLDCWGQPGHATAKYNLRIHPSAYDFNYSVRLEQSCCYEGQIQRFGQRLSSRRYQVGLTIDDWRAAYIYKAKVTYKRKVRI